MALSKDEIRQVVECDHPDPHRVLGAHPARTGVRVRAFRPDAIAVHVHPLDGSGEPTKLRETDSRGLFDGLVKGARLPLRYELDVQYPDGISFRLRDPYSFPPTLGELDLHLLAATKYEAMGEKKTTDVYFPEGETTHTDWAGAILNAGCVTEGIKATDHSVLAAYLLANSPAEIPLPQGKAR